MTIRASIVADSINPTDNRLTTWLLYYPRCIHSELMTHRAFSRNSASSRAIPIEAMIKRVLDDPFIPRWGTNQPGMVTASELTGRRALAAEDSWRQELQSAIERVRSMADRFDLHKSVVNRLLEPWMHIEVVLSATEFNNWFLLRDDPAAEPHIRDLAQAMRELYTANSPKFRVADEFSICQSLPDPATFGVSNYPSWHLPFISNPKAAPLMRLIRESVAHAAWVSYGNAAGKEGFTQEDVDRVYDKLVGSQPIHASPTEHVAVACNGPHRHGNFTGWCQWRQFLPGQSGGDYTTKP